MMGCLNIPTCAFYQFDLVVATIIFESNLY